MIPTKTQLSRREFARRAALGTAATSTILLPWPDLAAAGRGSSMAQISADAPKLSPQSQAEAEARYQSILAQYAERLSDAQKTDLQRLCFALQPQLDRLRAWPITNSAQPALYLKPLVEREKRSDAAPNLKSAPAAITPAKSLAPGKP
nr:hypothetical protein Hi04_10k_c5216_00018 [uncultured bacterium]